MKRFYREATVLGVEGGWQVALDTRPLKTQGGKAQVVPTQALADALAAEWNAQGEEIDPATFPLRDMVDYAIDRVATDPEIAIAAILPYGDTDTLCYRADAGDSLRKRQEEAWEPVLRTIEEREGLAFTRAEGVLHAPQAEATMARLRAIVAAFDPLTLVAVQNMASIAASLTIALASLEDGADIDALFAAANLEEDWQAIQWGWNGDALARRDGRLAGFTLAAKLAQLVKA
ncbi:ATP12 family chaperone protein [Croceicoccus bisphenolivorans]|uniref:ATP12 family chaperone protein n=1 Tax=Croceicoccus bisphenolivorans TaxID=1783232 RepID=UPI00082D3135|nr:ATP12 family protein [Croceicoccus bisphenolivorans]